MNLSEASANQQQEAIQRFKEEKRRKKHVRRQKWGQRLDIGRIAAAILLIAIGMICLLNNLGITAISFKYAMNLLWPALLIIIGLMLVISYRSIVAMIGGLLLMVAGTLFLINNTGLWTIDFRFAWNLLWPLIIIFIGATLLFKENGPAHSDLAPGFEAGGQAPGDLIPPMAPPPMPKDGPVLEAEYESAAPANKPEPGVEKAAGSSGPSLDKADSLRENDAPAAAAGDKPAN